jgi:hypothetical protein
MCLNSSKSSSASTSYDEDTVADNESTAIGGRASVSIDNSGFHGTDLKTITDFLSNYGQGLKDTTTAALDTIRDGQLNQQDSSAGANVQIAKTLGNLAWPIAAAVIAGIVINYFTKGKR